MMWWPKKLVSAGKRMADSHLNPRCYYKLMTDSAMQNDHWFYLKPKLLLQTDDSFCDAKWWLMLSVNQNSRCPWFYADSNRKMSLQTYSANLLGKLTWQTDYANWLRWKTDAWCWTQPETGLTNPNAYLYIKCGGSWFVGILRNIIKHSSRIHEAWRCAW